MSVRLSVFLSVTFVYCVETNKRNLSSNIFSPSGSHIVLVFPHQTLWQYSDRATSRFSTVFDEWYTVPIVKNTQNHWCTNHHRSTKTVPTVYQQRTNRHKQSKQHKMSRIHKAVCAYQQCCHLPNGNTTCPSLLFFKNNTMARGSQGFVCQSSRNVAHV